MEQLLSFSAGASWLCRLAARLAAIILLVLTAVIIYDVVGRKFFATGSFKLQELEWHLHGAIALLGIGYAYTTNAHVRIDIFAGGFSERLKLWMEFWAVLLFLVPCMLALMWYGYSFAQRSFALSETSPGGLGLSHRWIIKSLVPVAAFITLSGGLAVAARCLVALRRPDLLESPFRAEGLWKR